MAKIFLDPADSITVSNNNISVFGSTGTESITLAAGVTGTIFDQNTEKVLLSGAVSSFKFVQAGNQIKVSDSAGTVVATIPVQGDADGTALTFTDGTAQAILSGGVMKLGGATVSATTAGSVTPTTFDTTVKTPAPTPTGPTFSVAAGATSFTEGKSATFTVSLSSAQATSTTVNYAFAGTGGAVLGTDTGTATWTGATATATTLTFPAGIVTATVTVPVTFDSTVETGEGVSLTLSSPSTGITLGTATASTALADATAPSFTLTSDVVSGTPTQEGKSITFTITPSGTVDKDTVLTVNLTGQAVGGITSTASAADFTAAQTVTFKAGDTAARTTSITVVDDSTTEGIEGYKASLLDSTFTEKASTTGTITDPTTTYVLTGATSVNEDASVTYTVTADRAAPTGGITIPYTLSGNATLGTDYTGSAATGNITIAAGATTGTLILNAVADNLTESAAENIIVTLGTPSTGNVTTGTVTTLISDTSQGLTAGQVTLSASATSVNEGSAVTYTVTLGTAAPTGGLNIPYTLSGTSTLTSDYTGSAATTGNIAVAAGATTGTLTLTTVSDLKTEGAETIINTLGTLPTGYTLVTGKGATTTTINDTSVPVVGTTKQLTVSTDSITGSAGDDSIDASRSIQSGVAFNTLNNADSIDGGTGTDTLTVQMSENANITPASIKNVEALTVELISNNALSLTMTNSDSAITTVNTANNVNALTVANLQSAPSNFSVATTAQNFTATIANTALSGSADATALTINGVTAGTINIGPFSAASGYETISIVSSGSTKNGNTTDLVLDDGNGTSLATVNVSGSNDLDVDFTPATITKVDASTFTGKLDVDFLDGNVQTVSVVGGTGNDTIEVGATAGDYTSTDTITGGAGTDTLLLINADATNATATQSNVSGIEVIGVNLTSGTISMTNFGATGFAYSTIGVTAANDAAATTLNFSAGSNTLAFGTATIDTGAVTANIAGTATTDSLAITAGSTSAAMTSVTQAITITGAETLTLKSQGGANTFGSTFTITDTAATQSLTITGDQNLTFTGALRADVVDASGMTGSAALVLTGGTSTTATTITGTANADTLTGSTAGDIISGGAGADTLSNVLTGTAATAADVLTGGAGFDTFVLRGDTAQAASAVATAYAVAPSITDFTVGSTSTTTDIISLSTTLANYAGFSAFHAGIAATTAVAAGSTVVMGVAQNSAAAQALTSSTDLIKLTTGIATTGLTLQQSFNTAIGSATVTVGANTDGFVSWYDTTNSKMVIATVDSAGGAATTTIETADVVTLIGTIAMSATDYSTFSNANLALVVA